MTDTTVPTADQSHSRRRGDERCWLLRMEDTAISAAQLASVSAELRRWMDTIEPEPLKRRDEMPGRHDPPRTRQPRPDRRHPGPHRSDQLVTPQASRIRLRAEHRTCHCGLDPFRYDDDGNPLCSTHFAAWQRDQLAATEKVTASIEAKRKSCHCGLEPFRHDDDGNLLCATHFAAWQRDQLAATEKVTAFIEAKRKSKRKSKPL